MEMLNFEEKESIMAKVLAKVKDDYDYILIRLFAFTGFVDREFIGCGQFGDDSRAMPVFCIGRIG